MKKSYILSIVISLIAISEVNAMKPQRPEAHKMIDKALGGYTSTTTWLSAATWAHWSEIFAVLDSMKNDINIDEYRTPIDDFTLLLRAIRDNNFVATKMLLEKYHANPNIGNESNRIPLIYAIQQKKDLPLIKLLLTHKADPYLKDHFNKNAFDYANKNPAILELLNSYKQ